MHFYFSLAILAILAAAREEPQQRAGPTRLRSDPTATVRLESRDLTPRDATGRCPSGQTAISNGRTDTPNGCGPEKFEGLVPELWFHECCNAHDLCYSDCNQSKEACDDTFHSCMKAACDVEFGGFWKFFARAGCKGKAGIYFAAVDVGGKGSFNGATEEYCTCV